MEPQSLESSPSPSGPELARPAAVGALDLHVTDPTGGHLAGARVTVFNAGQSAILTTATTGADGSVLLERLAGPVKVSVLHALGHTMVDRAEIEPSQTRRLDVVVQPVLPVTLVLLPATIPVGSISADRSELELTVRIAASARAPFTPSSYPFAGQGSTMAPYLYLGRCSVRVNGPAFPRACETDRYGQVSAASYSYRPATQPIPNQSPSAYAALVLLEQGPRTADFDPGNLRWLAAGHFVSGIRSNPDSASPDVTAIAGFAGSGPGPEWAPLMLPQPPWVQPFGLTAFQSGTAAQMAAIASLRAAVVPPGVRAPVIDALRASYAITRDYAPATHRRAVVALLGGGDDAGREEAQRWSQQLALRREQDDAGVQTVLVAGRLDEGALERATIAELASALRAPLIYAGYPRNYTGWSSGSPHDGQYAALGLASELLSGDALPQVTATFRLKAEASSTFTSGSLLRGTLYMESDQCPMGCWELPLDFAVEIP